MNQNPLEGQPEITFKILDTITQDALLQMVELERISWGNTDTMSAEELSEWLQGAVVGAIYSGDRMVGNVITRTEANTESKQLILKNLPPESLNADGTAVHPDFRGRGLQKRLLLSRMDIARQFGKETILSCVRMENGASLRNIINTGARVLAYSSNYFPDSYNPGRLIWENDLVIPAAIDEKVEKKEGQFPDVVIDVKSGEVVDAEAQKAIAKILSEDYVGISVLTSDKDPKGVPLSSGIVFRHLSNFPPDMEKRLRERKEKIQGILKPRQEQLVRVEIATEKDWEAYQNLCINAIEINPEAFGGFGGPVEKAAKKTPDELKADLSSEQQFTVLAKTDSGPTGAKSMTGAGKREQARWHIHGVYTRPDSRGEGIAKKVFIKVLEEIEHRGGIKATLNVNKGSEQEVARKMYEKLGFEVLRDEKDHYFMGKNLITIQPQDKL